MEAMDVDADATGYSGDEVEEISDIEASVGAVENLLGYSFKQKKLLEEALTHSSCADSPSASYQRLEFVGDAALGLAVANFVYLYYPGIDPGKLSLLRSANTSTEKLARVAVRHRLYKYVRYNAAVLDERVTEFVRAVQEEKELEIYGGLVKAPKFLADIVESVAAALYIDCNFDLHITWKIFRHILEPIVMLNDLEQQPQPVTMLFTLYQKDGNQVRISYEKIGEKIFATVTVNGEFIASASSEHRELAKLLAAKAALEKLSHRSFNALKDTIFNQLNMDGEIEEAKQKLHELCGKKKWSKPNYKILKEACVAHQKRFTCSVEIDLSMGSLVMEGKEKPRVREAESSAASAMLFGLKNSDFI